MRDNYINSPPLESIPLEIPNIQTICEEGMDEYYYIIKQQARQSYDYSTCIKSSGRTVQEFKQQIFTVDP
jgi:hypothetical protein